MKAVDEDRDIVVRAEIRIAAELCRSNRHWIAIVGADRDVQRVAVAGNADDSAFTRRYAFQGLPLSEVGYGVGQRPDRLAEPRVERDRPTDVMDLEHAASIFDLPSSPRRINLGPSDPR